MKSNNERISFQLFSINWVALVCLCIKFRLLEKSMREGETEGNYFPSQKILFSTNPILI